MVASQTDLLEMIYDSVGAANPGGNARLRALLRAVVPDPDEADAKFAAITGRGVSKNLHQPDQVGVGWVFSMGTQAVQAAELDIPSGVDDHSMGDPLDEHYNDDDVETFVLKQEQRGATDVLVCGGCFERKPINGGRHSFHVVPEHRVRFWRDGELVTAPRGSLRLAVGQCLDPAFSNMENSDSRRNLIKVGCIKRSFSDGHFYVTDSAKAAGGLQRCRTCQALITPSHSRNIHQISVDGKRQSCPGPIQIELQQGPWCLDKSLVHKKG